VSGAGRTAVVTGAARGIGRGITDRLLGEGWQVLAVDVDPAPLPPGRPGLNVLAADVAIEADVAQVVEVAARLSDQLEGLVCNAGIMIRKPLEALSLVEWRRVLDVNLGSAFLLARAAAPALRRGHGGIVTVASTRAHMSEPDTESYSASKGGLVALTHALSVSLGPEVRANCVSPGWIDTAADALRPEDHAQHPAGRVGRVEDVAALVSWLLGPQSGFVTGAEFVIDGGMTRKMIYRD